MQRTSSTYISVFQPAADRLCVKQTDPCRVGRWFELLRGEGDSGAIGDRRQRAVSRPGLVPSHFDVYGLFATSALALVDVGWKVGSAAGVGS